MYDELVKRLQDFAAGTMRDEDAQLAFDAADAIEQLSNAGSAYGRGWTLEKNEGKRKKSFEKVEGE